MKEGKGNRERKREREREEERLCQRNFKIKIDSEHTYEISLVFFLI